MYTLQNAARVLGVSRQTVRKWIEQDNIETTMLETDRKRIYLAYNDILALADKHRPLKVHGTEQDTSSQDLTGLYSIDDASRLLGVKRKTISKWLSKSNIERKIIITDQRRAYISYSGLVTLAEKHNVSIAYDKVEKEQKSSTQEPIDHQEEKLYTVADAALFLGVAEETVREWLSRYNIERKTLGNDLKHIYISCCDIFMLASKQKHAATYAANMTTNIREIRYRLEQIEAGILNLEKYIKRSIYVGK
jgi:excisionase family DNA binding protein